MNKIRTFIKIIFLKEIILRLNMNSTLSKSEMLSFKRKLKKKILTLKKNI